MTLYYDDLVMSPYMVMDQELLEYWRDWIEQASLFEMVVMERYAPGGHIVFSSIGLQFLFDKKLEKFGGINSIVSKRVGYIDKISDVITFEQFTELMKNA